MASVKGLDHVSVLVADAQRSLIFYQQTLGLKTADRPDLGFPGYWLDLGQGQTLHLMQLENPYHAVTRPRHGGRDMHFALRVDNLETFADTLRQHHIAFTQSRSGRRALFFRDPDQNVIELFEPQT